VALQTEVESEIIRASKIYAYVSKMATRVWSTARWIAGYQHHGAGNTSNVSTIDSVERSRVVKSFVITNSTLQKESELDNSRTNERTSEDQSQGASPKKLSAWFEYIILTSICIVVVTGFCIPVVVYITGADHSSGRVRAAIDVYRNFSNCSRDDRDQLQVSGI